MAIQAEPNKNGIISLVAMMILIILVVALSEPIYRALSKDTKAGTTYTSTQQGYGGEVIVRLTVEDGQVVSLIAEGNSETPTVGQKAVSKYNETTFSELSDAYIDEVSTHLDAVSGATITSAAVAAGFQAVIEEAQEAEKGNSK
ncbi:MAG: FMN-binding protein [Lachnospiraceae bacterium]|nr:FMN-binding protein [Lachnospiraceae bacterium]